jgi:hypothetical protein
MMVGKIMGLVLCAVWALNSSVSAAEISPDIMGCVGSNSGYNPGSGWFVIGNANPDANHMFVAIEKFPISGLISADRVVLSHSITTNYSSAGGQNYFVVQHYTFDNSRALCWDDVTSSSATETISSVQTASIAKFTFDVTLYVNQDIANGYTHSSFRIVLTDANGTLLTDDNGQQIVVFDSSPVLAMNDEVEVDGSVFAPDIIGCIGASSGINPGSGWFVIGNANPDINHMFVAVEKFTITGLPTIPSATPAILTNKVTTSYNSEGDLNYFVVQHYTFDNSRALCWDDVTSSSATETISDVTVAELKTFALDVTSYVNQDIANGYTHSAFRIVLTNENGTPLTDDIGQQIVVFDMSPTLAIDIAAPVFSPSSPYIKGSTRVSMSCETEGAVIYYMTDGTKPSMKNGMLYTGPVTVNDKTTLKAVSILSGISSMVTSVTYEYNPPRVDLTRGQYLLAEKGLQIQALAFPQVGDQILFTMNRFNTSNFTGINCWAYYLEPAWFGDSEIPQWGRWCYGRVDLNATELLYLDKMVSFQYMDEQDISVSSNVTAAASWIALNKERYPDVISYTNQYGGQNTLSELKAYVQSAQPDMVMFDRYPFTGLLLGGSPTGLYSNMQIYRQAGLSGLDGQGNEPIPYALYLQMYTETNGMQHVVSDSEMRLNQFAAWAFGFKFAEGFIYSADGDNIHSVLFDGVGDTTPTEKFYQVAETNRQSRNLGPALVRLISSDVRMIMGQHSLLGIPMTNPTPDDVTTGLSGADDYLIDVSATNIGSTNGGLRGDVIVGFFKPLHESYDGDDYSNQKYFMVVNGLSDGNATAAETKQTIRLTFNFGSSGITKSLQRLNRNTGAVEIVSLVSDGGSVYHLDLTLDGGTGDLFKYNTGAPFVGVATPKIPGDANGDGMVDVGDLGILAANYGGSGKTWALGDFNGDGLVDVGDLGILAANYGTGATSTMSWAAAYAKAFGTTTDEADETSADSSDDSEEATSSVCSSLGLSLIAGLAMMGLMIVKLEE